MKFFISGAINPDMFITNQGCADYFGIEGISTFYCTFDSSCYFDHLFEYFGIPLPESLKAAVAKRKAGYLAGRYSAQQALTLSGYPSEVVVIGNHRSPVWSKTVVGSITHTNDTAICIT